MRRMLNRILKPNLIDEGEKIMGLHSITRRAAVGGGALCAMILVTGSMPSLSDKAHGSTEQVGFLVDLAKCIGCEKCVAACRSANHLPSSAPNRRQVHTYYTYQGDEVYASVACMHCEDPSCLTVCPAQAISKGEAGIVAVDKSRCIGCKYCYQACPYGIPHYLPTGMDKCDCCLDIGVKPGEQPYCARACIFGGLTFGTVSELKELAPHAEVIAPNNGPSCLVTTQMLLSEGGN